MWDPNNTFVSWIRVDGDVHASPLALLNQDLTGKKKGHISKSHLKKEVVEHGTFQVQFPKEASRAVFY